MLDQTLKYDGGVGNGVQTPFGNPFDPFQRASGLAGDDARGGQRLVGADLVLVDDPQWVTGDAHLQQRQVSPTAANRIEGVGAEPARDGLQDLSRAGADLDRVEGVRAFQRERAERNGDAAAGRAAAHLDQFEAGPAQVANHAFGVRRPGQDAERGIMSLFLAGEHAHRKAGLGLEAAHEVRAVRGLADGGGGDHEDRGRVSPPPAPP